MLEDVEFTDRAASVLDGAATPVPSAAQHLRRCLWWGRRCGPAAVQLERVGLGGVLEVLGHGEVILRNAMHDELTAHHRRRGDPGEWFDDPQRVLTLRALDDVKTAKQRAGRAAPPGKVVAELSLGFWRYLLAHRYAATLWPAIRHAFPNLPRRGQRTLEGHVSDLHLLRNRIAHHEPLINVPLQVRLESLQYVLDRIDPQIRRWALDDGGSLTTLLQNRP